MKFSALIFLCHAAFQPYVVVQGNEAGCVTEVTEGKDYFPNQVSPEHSKLWSVTYESTYKIVSNTAAADGAGESYLLYQCGTEPPAEELDGRHALVLSVPLDDFGLLYTTMIPFFEMLGARESITAYLNPFIYVSSPCLNDLFDQGLVEEVVDPYNATAITNIPLNVTSFVGSSGGTGLQSEIKVSEYQEKTNLAVFEWIKFYSLFLNKEEMANEIFDATKARYECVEDNAAILACGDEKKPVVLWASYSTYCQGWDVAQCPNYYCEFAQICQAEFLSSEQRGSIESELCMRNYMTTEEFVAFGKNADIWIYEGADFDDTFAMFGANLTDFVSIQNQQVYDTEGQGANAWYEQRLADPDVVLQDFCNLVGTENLAVPVPHQRVWFRNVFTESERNAGQCEDPAAPLESKATECEALPASTVCQQGAGTSSDTTNVEGSSASSALTRGCSVAIAAVLAPLVIATAVVAVV